MTTCSLSSLANLAKFHCHVTYNCKHDLLYNIRILEYGPMPNVMAALPNICGAICSTPQSLAEAHYYSAVQ